MEKITIVCPCCEAALTVDASTGALIAHEEKKKKLGSFEDLRSDLDKQKELREQLFSQEQQAQKDRQRILQEKFDEAFKKADKNPDEPFKNPLDYD
jgi:predicted amidophosphoribosyltransferase